MRLVDVLDPDGNRIQLAQDISRSMIRKGSAADVPFLRSMLTHAYAWRVNALDADIPLTRYVDDWGRAGDLAVIAHETGHRVGAAWFRLFPADEPGYGFVDERDAGAVDLGRARRAADTAWGRSCWSAAREGEGRGPRRGLALGGERLPAVAFYERNGFEPAGESDGGLVMKRAL